MQRLRIPAPQEKQRSFLLAKKKHVGFGGARGGGKSWAVRTKAKLLALRYAGIRILIVRRTYPELINNHIGILRTELCGIAKYNDKDKVLKFRNGSSIHFAYCAKDADLDRLQGVEYDVIFLDEATQLSEFQMKAIIACLRGVNAFPKRVYYTCNPGGQGHAYIKRIFIDRKYDEGEDPDDYEFIQSRVTDNAAMLQAQPDVQPDGVTIALDKFNDYSIDLACRVYITKVNLRDFMQVKNTLNLQILDLMQEEGCEFAFPTTTVDLPERK